MGLNRISTEVSWWIPGGSLVYSGTPKTRATWISLTWRAYLAYWHLMLLSAWILLRQGPHDLPRLTKND